MQTEWSDSDISLPLLMAARTHLRSAVQIRRFGPEFVPASEWDRMVHNAYRIELKGDSQRKKRPPGCPSPPQLGGGKEREQKATESPLTRPGEAITIDISKKTVDAYHTVVETT